MLRRQITNELRIPKVSECIRIDHELHVKLFFTESPVPKRASSTIFHHISKIKEKTFLLYLKSIHGYSSERVRYHQRERAPTYAFVMVKRKM